MLGIYPPRGATYFGEVMQQHDQSTLLAMLNWQIELGATEAIGDAPVDRFALPTAAEAKAKTSKAASPLTLAPAPDIDPIAEAEARAAAATTLEDLADQLNGYDHCDLKKGARTLVFSDGNPAARVMIVGEAPGRDEDIQGKPFVGRAGQLLDLMFAAIGLDRTAPDPAQAFYITNVLPWRPPQNRDPSPDEISMMLPFVRRHIALAEPDVLVLMGNHSCQALLGRRGITRLRGTWTEALGRPALPMFHPAYLLRNAHAKRDAWVDLLRLQSHLRQS